MKVAGNIAYPLRCRRRERALVAEKVRALARAVGIAHLLDRDPGTLSAGEAHRAALARTLATDPRILLLDEPLASLDVQAKSAMRSLLRNLNRSGRTIVHVTHDYEEAVALASTIAILERGRITQAGPPDEIFRRPKSEFIANFVGIKNFYRGVLTKTGANSGLFKVNGLELEIATSAPGGAGNLILRSEDITISKTMSETSARNHFRGRIKEVEKVRLGVEVLVDIGVDMAALITEASFKKMDLHPGDEVILNFKATAGKFYQ